LSKAAIVVKVYRGDLGALMIMVIVAAVGKYYLASGDKRKFLLNFDESDLNALTASIKAREMLTDTGSSRLCRCRWA